MNIEPYRDGKWLAEVPEEAIRSGSYSHSPSYQRYTVEFRLWMVNNFAGRRRFRFSKHLIGSVVIFHRVNDAILFKMRWG